MITPQLKKGLIKRRVTKVNINFTSADRDRPLADFDQALNELYMKIRKIAPDAYFASNGSTENHSIELDNVPEPALEKVVSLFEQTHLQIASEHHFLQLF